jgi:hypothetical protein
MFPPKVPLGGDIDFHFLATQFCPTVENIRNVAMDAAFLAAADGRIVWTWRIVQTLARQVVKQGVLPSASDFKRLFSFIMVDADARFR